jgi:hypothetical protein
VSDINHQQARASEQKIIRTSKNMHASKQASKQASKKGRRTATSSQRQQEE